MKCDEIFIWDRLKSDTRPIVLYGTGNGAEKLIAKAKYFGVKISDIFASDGFVRNREFMGYPVRSFGDIKHKYKEFICLLGFAAGSPELISQIKSIAYECSEFFVPEVPVFGEDIFTPEMLDLNSDKLDTLYEMLADEQSKKVFRGLIDYKISGKPQYLYDIETPREEIFDSIFTFRKDEVYYDLGAFTGDTVEEFVENTGNSYRHIIAVEPAPKNYERLISFIKEKKLEKITPKNVAVSGERQTVRFSEKGGRNPFISEKGKIEVESLTLPELSELLPSYIKMDIEGAEYETLLAGAEIIKKAKPKLNISVYHRTTDFFEIPLYIKSLCPDYELYLRHHPYLPAWDTDLYAKKKKK